MVELVRREVAGVPSRGQQGRDQQVLAMPGLGLVPGAPEVPGDNVEQLLGGGLLPQLAAGLLGQHGRPHIPWNGGRLGPLQCK